MGALSAQGEKKVRIMLEVLQNATLIGEAISDATQVNCALS